MSYEKAVEPKTPWIVLNFSAKLPIPDRSGGGEGKVNYFPNWESSQDRTPITARSSVWLDSGDLIGSANPSAQGGDCRPLESAFPDAAISRVSDR